MSQQKTEVEETIIKIIAGIRWDCSDRRGIKNAFENLDDDIEIEINNVWTKIIEREISPLLSQSNKNTLEEIEKIIEKEKIQLNKENTTSKLPDFSTFAAGIMCGLDKVLSTLQELKEK